MPADLTAAEQEIKDDVNSELARDATLQEIAGKLDDQGATLEQISGKLDDDGPTVATDWTYFTATGDGREGRWHTIVEVREATAEHRTVTATRDTATGRLTHVDYGAWAS